MSGTTEKTVMMNVNGEAAPPIKYKDPYTFLCSTRWRIAAYIFLSFILLYSHRVNLSLAVVCMMDTTGSHTSPEQINSSETEINLTSPNITSYLLNGVLYSFENGSSGTELEPVEQCGSEVSDDIKDWTPELDWKKSEVSILLSSYFYGSFFTQIPAGTLADTFGGKHIITAAMLVTAVCSLLTPVCARTSIILMFVVRIAIGLAGGSVIPAGMSMINAWSTPNERPLMIAVTAAGLLIGTIITYLTSGLLCAYGFDNGWPSIFYIHGSVAVLFTCLWVFEAYNYPSLHPRISKGELEHIQRSKGQTANVKCPKPKTPWIRLMTSKAQWATIIVHFCFNWGFFTLLINVPLFLKEVLKYDVKSNGLFSAVPFVFQIIVSLFAGKLSAVIIKRKIIGHLATRRLFTSISLLGIAVCLICAGYVSCENRYIAVILLCSSCAFAGLSYGGFFANHPEYAGQFAGTAFGITNAGGVVSSLLASMMAGLLTPNGLQEEWQHVLYIAAGVNVIGATAFVLCSDVHLQPWARNQEQINIEVDTTWEPAETTTVSIENKLTGAPLELQEIQQLKLSEKSSNSALDIEENTPLNIEEESNIDKSPTIQEPNQFDGSSIHPS